MLTPPSPGLAAKNVQDKPKPNTAFLQALVIVKGVGQEGKMTTGAS